MTIRPLLRAISGACATARLSGRLTPRELVTIAGVEYLVKEAEAATEAGAAVQWAAMAFAQVSVALREGSLRL